MKKTRATLLVIASLCAIGGSFAWVKSQTAAPIAVRHSASRPSNRHRPTISATNGMVVQLTEQLKLNASQKAQLGKIFDAMQHKVASIQGTKSMDPAKKQEAMAKEMNVAAASLSEILDPTQKEKFEQMMEQMRAQHASH